MSGCTGDPYSRGLCQKHHEEKNAREQRRNVAINTLSTLAIDGRLPDEPSLKEELLLLQEWWNRARLALQTGDGDHFMPLNQAEYALEWCISLAQEIVDAELAFRPGKAPSYALEMTRKWVWDEFKEVEVNLRKKGLNP